MKIGDIVSTPDGLGKIVEKYLDRPNEATALIYGYIIFGVVLDSPRPDDPVKKYYRNELKLVYSPK